MCRCSVHGFGGGWPPQSHHGIIAPTHVQSCTVERGHVNRNDMEKVGIHQAYLVHSTRWETTTSRSLRSLLLCCEILNMLVSEHARD
jgi:hypothetical protein